MSGVEELKEKFKEAQNVFQWPEPHLLEVKSRSHNGPNVYVTYDFFNRAVYMRTGSSDGGVIVTQFKDADREVLEAMHAHLKRMGGNPPPLPVVCAENSGLEKVPSARSGVNLG